MPVEVMDDIKRELDNMETLYSVIRTHYSFDNDEVKWVYDQIKRLREILEVTVWEAQDH